MVQKYCIFSSATFFRQRSFPSLAVERDQPAIGRHEVEPVAVHAEAAIAHQVAALILPAVVPDLLAGAGVERPGMVGNGEVEDAVDHQRSGFDGGVADAALRADIGDAVEPGEREAADVGGVDLGERAEAPAGIIAVVGGPGVDRRLEEQLRVEALAGGRQGDGDQSEDRKPSMQFHLRVTR